MTITPRLENDLETARQAYGYVPNPHWMPSMATPIVKPKPARPKRTGNKQCGSLVRDGSRQCSSTAVSGSKYCVMHDGYGPTLEAPDGKK